MKQLLFWGILFSMVLFSANAQNVEKNIHFDFRYDKDQTTILRLDVTNNKAEYAKLTNILTKDANVRNDILTGKKYISIVACIMHLDIGEDEIINRAAEQLSVVRAVLKSKLNIPHESVAVVIDTTQGRRNRVYVNIFNGNVPKGFEASQLKFGPKKFVDKIPYGNYNMILKNK